MSAFKNVSKGKMGYAPVEVDAFLALARDQYNNASAQLLDWRDITGKKFALQKGGYEVAAVDVAIDKLQDTFAERELKRAENPFAPSLTGTVLTELRGLLMARAIRPKGKRFSRSGFLGIGYNVKQVDALLSVVEEFLEGEDDVTLDEIRKLTFKVQRGGYFESQVDAFVERLVEYLQTQRFGGPIVVNPIVATTDSHTGSGDDTNPYSEYQ